MEDTKYWLTKEGLEKIKKEYQSLKEKKEELIQSDVWRNFRLGEVDSEYLEIRQEIERIEMLMAELEDILKKHKIIKKPSQKDRVFLGAKITVEVEGEIDEFTLVGPLEANPLEGKISTESLVGQAFLGKKKGEEVIVNSEIKIVYKIKKIRY